MEEAEYLSILRDYGQNDFIDKYEALDESLRRSVLRQADNMDLTMLKGVEDDHKGAPKGVISPIRTLSMAESEPDRERYRKIGIEAVRAGRVGAVLLAGGMGTRLGYDHAKGMCDIGLTRPVYIFQRAIENLLDTVRECGGWVDLYIMTSRLNDSETQAFMREHGYFGYDPEHVFFFVQDMAPCLDENMHMLFEAPGVMATSPNGNGGFYSSMLGSGIDEIAKSHGVEYLDVVAVDNVLQRIADPVFVGAVIDGDYDTGAKVVRKADPDERVGAICLEDGAPSVVEYYDMTDELKAARDEQGRPAYDYGVILNYLFKMSSIDRVIRNALPIHVVKKKIPYMDENGQTIVPESPNGYKLETLVLDLVHLTGTCLPFEVDRRFEFAPIKNATGVDSVVTAREMLVNIGYTL